MTTILQFTTFQPKSHAEEANDCLNRAIELQAAGKVNGAADQICASGYALKHLGVSKSDIQAMREASAEDLDRAIAILRAILAALKG